MAIFENEEAGILAVGQYEDEEGVVGWGRGEQM